MKPMNVGMGAGGAGSVGANYMAGGAGGGAGAGAPGGSEEPVTTNVDNLGLPPGLAKNMDKLPGNNPHKKAFLAAQQADQLQTENNQLMAQNEELMGMNQQLQGENQALGEQNGQLQQGVGLLGLLSAVGLLGFGAATQELQNQQNGENGNLAMDPAGANTAIAAGSQGVIQDPDFPPIMAMMGLDPALA